MNDNGLMLLRLELQHEYEAWIKSLKHMQPISYVEWLERSLIGYKMQVKILENKYEPSTHKDKP